MKKCLLADYKFLFLEAEETHRILLLMIQDLIEFGFMACKDSSDTPVKNVSSPMLSKICYIVKEYPLVIEKLLKGVLLKNGWSKDDLKKLGHEIYQLLTEVSRVLPGITLPESKDDSIDCLSDYIRDAKYIEYDHDLMSEVNKVINGCNKIWDFIWKPEIVGNPIVSDFELSIPINEHLITIGRKHNKDFSPYYGGDLIVREDRQYAFGGSPSSFELKMLHRKKLD